MIRCVFSRLCESSLALELLEHQALGSCAGGSTAVSMRLFLALWLSQARDQPVEPLVLPLSSEGSSVVFFLFFPFPCLFLFLCPFLFLCLCLCPEVVRFFSWHVAWLHVFASEGAIFIRVTVSFAAAFSMDGTRDSLRGFSGDARVFGRVVILTRSAAVPAVVLKFTFIAKWGLLAFEAMAFSWAMCAVQFARRASGGSIKPNEAVGRIGHSVSTLGEISGLTSPGVGIIAGVV